MAERPRPLVETLDREMAVSRLIEAPRDLVYAAWTDPAQAGLWWGPNGFTTTIREMNVRPGGLWLFTMHGPDGRDYPNRICYRELDPPRRIAYDHGSGVAGEPGQFQAVAAFEEVGAGTRVTLRAVFSSVEERDLVVRECNAVEAGNQTLARLEAHVALRMEPDPFVITRVFDAPRDLVFKAWSEGERLAHWWGPRGFALEVASLDFRDGGGFHYGMKAPEGFSMWGRIQYREIVPPSRIVTVLHFSDEQGGITRHPLSATWPLRTLNVLTLAEKDGRTLLTLESVPFQATKKERETFREGHASMINGYTGTFDLLAQYLSRI